MKSGPTVKKGQDNCDIRNQALSKGLPRQVILNSISRVSDRKTPLRVAKMKSQIQRMRAEESKGVVIVNIID